MEPKQDKHKSIYSKRKQAKTFSELKNHSKSGDYYTPSAETFRKIDELRTRYDYNKDKYIHDVRQKKKVERREVPENTDVYQCQKNNCYLMLKPKDIYFYDIKHKCYYSRFYHTYGANSCYNYFGRAVNRLLIFMECTNKTMERLFRELNETQNTPDLSAVILVINSKNVEELFKLKKVNIKKSLKKGYFNYKARDTSLFFSNVTNKHFDIKIKNHCSGLKISIRKYSRPLLETLTAVCNLARCFFPTYEIEVPTVYGRKWYFHNVIQGIILNIILVNIKVNNLNVMRQLYLVLVSYGIPILSTEINLILKKGIYTIYGANSSKQFTSKMWEWSYFHKYILRKFVSTRNWHTINKLNERLRNSLIAITYYTTSTASDHELSSCDLGSTESFDGKTYVRCSNTDILYSLSNSDIALFFPVNQSVGTSFIFPTNEMTFNQYRQNETRSASTNCCIEQNTSLLSKLFLGNLCNDLNLVNLCLNVYEYSQNQVIHETLFQAVHAVTDYAKFVDQCWKQSKSRTLYTNLLKCLTQNLIYTFLSSTV